MYYAARASATLFKLLIYYLKYINHHKCLTDQITVLIRFLGNFANTIGNCLTHFMETCYITYSDEKILYLIAEEDDRHAFTELYNRYFKILFNYTFSKVNDEFIAQEIVQELFVSIWQKRNTNSILVCRPYLFSIAKRLIITHYRKQNTRQQHYSEWTYRTDLLSENTDHQLLTSDLENSYQDSLQLLPPKCKQVFLLSRQGHPNRKIAEELSISEKTVEQHISKALRVLKESMKEYITYSILFFILFFI